MPGQKKIFGTYFCYSLSRSRDHRAAGRIMSLKNPYDPIEPATFWLVAQCLNCATACPTQRRELLKYKRKNLHSICWAVYHGIMDGIWVTFPLQSCECKPVRHDMCVGERAERG
jgi:hypothetical protein